jgi:membrane fusion protein (multidrug efflux system)
MSMAGKTRKRLIIMLAAVALLFGGVFGFGAFKSIMIARFLATFAHQVQTVSTITAATSSWQPQIQSVGSVTPVNGASLSAEISGIVDTINFESGKDVQKGDLLLTLRPNNDPAVLAQLQATQKLDEITYARDQKQFLASAVSQAQLDTDRANLQAAKAQVQAQQALIAEKLVRAPFSGRLGIRQVDPGQYLAAGTAIVTLEQLNPLYVDFYLPQQALAALQVGQGVSITVDAFPGQVFTGQISAIEAAVDSATRSIQVRATLPNDNMLLRPGMFTNVEVNTGAPRDDITLPQTAITYNPYGDTVFLVKHGQDDKGKPALVAQQVFVTLGTTRGDQVAVVSGVKPGDIVVTAGQLKLRNNTLVAVDNTVQPTNSPTPNPPNE